MISISNVSCFFSADNGIIKTGCGIASLFPFFLVKVGTICLSKIFTASPHLEIQLSNEPAKEVLQ